MIGLYWISQFYTEFYWKDVPNMFYSVHGNIQRFPW